MEAQIEQHTKINELFRASTHTIETLQNAVRREIPSLLREFDLTDQQEQTLLNDFVNDECTLFRALRKSDFSVSTASSLMLDTIRWRLERKLDAIRLPSVADAWLSSPFVFFHKVDKLNRPVLMVQLQHLPSVDNDRVTVDDFMKSLETFTLFVLETARLLVWDTTSKSLDETFPSANSVVLGIIVLVDFQNAAALLINNTSLLKLLFKALKRFPGLIDGVYLVNFSWMYQGLWQMFKPMLPAEARSKIEFPRLGDLQKMIDADNLLKDLGGKDAFSWSRSVDLYYTKYRAPLPKLPSLSLSPALSRNSSASTIYYDTQALFDMSNMHNTITPTVANSQHLLSRPASSISSYTTPLTSLSRVSSRSDLMPSNAPTESKKDITEPPDAAFWFRFLRCINLKNVARKARVKFAKHKASCFCWLIVCILFRRGIQEVCQRILSLVMKGFFLLIPLQQQQQQQQQRYRWATATTRSTVASLVRELTQRSLTYR